MALGCVARPPGQQRQPPVEALEQHRRGERAHAGGGELDREREPVEAPADLGDDLAVAVPEREVRPHLAGSAHEERLGVGRGEGRHGQLLLVPQPQRRPRGRDHGQIGGGREQSRDERSGLQHVLEVVDAEQQLTIRHERLQGVLDLRARRLSQAERLRYRRGHERRLARRRQLDDGRAVAVAIPQPLHQRQRQPRLARPAGPGQRHESGTALEQTPHPVQLRAAPDQPGRRRMAGRRRCHRQTIRESEAMEGRTTLAHCRNAPR